MRKKLLCLVIPALLGVLPLTAFAAGYYSGGSAPFPREVQAVLDRHARILTLGVNHDWMQSAGVEPVAYSQAIEAVASAVERSEIPGALIYVDRMLQVTMPTGIGYRIVDPERRPVEPDTLYAAQDLTGPLVTVPMVLGSLLTGQAKKEQTLSSLFPEFVGTDKAPITLAMLLRHSSGFGNLPAERRYADRNEMLRDLAAQKLLQAPGQAVHRSPANFLLLGLAMEKIHGKPYSELANERVFRLLQESTAKLKIGDTNRAGLAPGIYSPFLGRMAWGEATDSAGQLLDSNAGHNGLVLSADHAADMARMLMTMAALNVGKDGKALTVIGEAFQPDPSIPGGEKMGLGYQVGRFGPTSFGWDSPAGSSFWMLPAQQGFVVYLSNADHPKGPGPKDPRDVALPALVRSLLPMPPAPIDTAGRNAKVSPAVGTSAGPR